ncbi:MAG: hypothetical protein RBT74_17385 [Tenuifilaceae bacterium]|jgi:hypothetical protein|nr:hypothetical protein [Tenuifilaceae bacterium]
METNSDHPMKDIDQDYYAQFDGGLEFFNEPFDIKAENKLSVFRLIYPITKIEQTN